MSDNALSFDRCQWDGRRARAITAETRIAHSDYVRMGMQKAEGHSRSPRRVPMWTADNAKIANIIRVKLWRYVHNVGVPPDSMTLAELEAAAAVRRAKYSCTEKSQKAHLIATQRHGVAGFLARLIWSSFRLHYTSSAVAQDMQLTSVQVRQQLHRITAIGRELYPDESLPPCARLRTRLGHVKDAVFSAQVCKMREAGKTVPEIARALGCSRNRCRRAARRAGTIS